MIKSKTISISLRGVVKLYFQVYLVLLTFHVLSFIVMQALGIDERNHALVFFNFNKEVNLPALFSVLLILQAAGMCLAIGILQKKRKLAWLLLTFLFTFLAFDELCGIHEKLADPVRESLGTTGFFYFAWIIPYGVMVIIIGSLLIPWLISLPGPTRKGFIMSGIIFIAGAVVMEGLGGWYMEIYQTKTSLVYNLMVIVEESLEMFGFIFFFYYAAEYFLREIGINHLNLRE